ncbi:hypothetical protein CRG98_023523 [Punica granatum]|uniref:Integrase catalytic domain-containing protein n=1 Tax=Punica granatum TaxID=22663 RepID=A0A2I0JIL5_PUNGR|nr:hypothetical protein CRG98_023523 [Punica granatum]
MWMMNLSMLKGLPQLEVHEDTVYLGRRYRKVHQLPYKESSARAKEPLELIHSSVFGRVKEPSIRRMRYMMTFIDDCSKYIWVYFMKEKSETLARFMEFKEKVGAKTGKKIKCLRIDNGGEDTSQKFTDYLRQCKIWRQLTCLFSPQQNGVKERKNRPLAEVCRSMLHAKHVPSRFWAEYMKTAAHIINRLPQPKLGFVSPYQKL